MALVLDDNDTGECMACRDARFVMAKLRADLTESETCAKSLNACASELRAENERLDKATAVASGTIAKLHARVRELERVVADYAIANGAGSANGQ